MTLVVADTPRAAAELFVLGYWDTLEVASGAGALRAIDYEAMAYRVDSSRTADDFHAAMAAPMWAAARLRRYRSVLSAVLAAGEAAGWVRAWAMHRAGWTTTKALASTYEATRQGINGALRRTDSVLWDVLCDTEELCSSE